LGAAVRRSSCLRCVQSLKLTIPSHHDFEIVRKLFQNEMQGFIMRQFAKPLRRLST